MFFMKEKKNGARVEYLNNRQLQELVPVIAITDRALWSPNTSVVNPKEVVYRLKEELLKKVLKYLPQKKNGKLIQLTTK